MTSENLAPATLLQEASIRALYERYPIFHGDLTPSQLAEKAGWEFNNYSLLPPEKFAGDWWWTHPNLGGEYGPLHRESTEIVIAHNLANLMTYDEFRATVQIGCDCLMVRWQGMWIGIEKDGYTHS